MPAHSIRGPLSITLALIVMPTLAADSDPCATEIDGAKPVLWNEYAPIHHDFVGCIAGTDPRRLTHEVCLPLNLRCRAGDQVIYQRTNTIPYSYQATTIPCRKQIGPTQIWRAARPSPYGIYVFQVACGGDIITNYKTHAATYETTQRFVIAIACVMILVSLIGLLRHLFHSRWRRSSAT